MEQQQKDTLLNTARTHVSETQKAIDSGIIDFQTSIEKTNHEIRTSKTESEDIKMLQEAMVAHSEDLIQDLQSLRPSPYFTRCDISFDDEPEPKTHFFGKFSFDKSSIYSWTTPIASLRFEEPGAVSYTTPEDGERTGTLLRRDQYMIVDGNIIFMATESTENPRQLVYQEYLSARKNSFALPEIVAQMEKAQDHVIRAHHAGPFAISGPAGSGKTTLALHRVAYLTQSPDTTMTYPGRSIIVFVQDNGTKDYFSHLLPELGIHNVRITTFSEWALELLDIDSFHFQSRIGRNETERDQYEYAKLRAIKTQPLPSYRRGSEFTLLETFYAPYLTLEQQELFQKQRTEGSVDRYDLTLLLHAKAKRENGFSRTRMLTIRLKDGRTKQQPQKEMLEYSLMVVDEFQNYLPLQLRLLNMCLKKPRRSILYVGDMAQQTQFGTLRTWEDTGEQINAERLVRLHKVYRNTKNILEYIRSLGYSVEIPDGIRSGKDVQEIICTTPQEEISYLKHLLETTTVSIGVLSKDGDYLAEFSTAFSNEPRIRFMSIREAQGVEFEIVCIVGMNSETFTLTDDELADAEYASEKSRINRDLLYVALTRAISELHVLTTSELKTLLPA